MDLKRSTRGVTLVETMAAILVFSIVGISIVNLCLQGSLTGKRAEQAFVAYNIAKNHIEELRNVPFSSLASSTETDTALNSAGVADPEGAFLRTTSVSTSYTGDSSLTQVSVSVNYYTKGHVSQNPTTIITVLSQYS